MDRLTSGKIVCVSLQSNFFNLKQERSMNITSVNKNIYFNINSYMSAFRIEPNLYKFISIISAENEIKNACKKNRLVTWLHCNELKNRPYTMSEYRSVVFTALGLNWQNSLRTFKERTDIAKQYARILDQYCPDEKGEINQSFNYYQLVSIIKNVFENHIWKDQDLFSSGLEVFSEGQTFYAKVEVRQVFIFSAKCKDIGKGNFGRVGEIYEIASCQLLALKWARKNNPTACEHIVREISVLKDLQATADFEDCSLKGLQDPPLATLHLSGLNGFLGIRYGIDLHKWCRCDRSNESRLKMCKFIVKAYMAKEDLEIWHGDIKLENILMHDDEVVFIDWDGSIYFQQGARDLKYPRAMSTGYISLLDFDALDALIREGGVSGITDDLYIKYLESAKSLELFSLAIVLFCVLVSKEPFDMQRNEEYDEDFPFTNDGIRLECCRSLLERKYESDVVQTITKMLSHDPRDRYSIQHIKEFWI